MLRLRLQPRLLRLLTQGTGPQRLPLLLQIRRQRRKRVIEDVVRRRLLDPLRRRPADGAARAEVAALREKTK